VLVAGCGWRGGRSWIPNCRKRWTKPHHQQPTINIERLTCAVRARRPDRCCSGDQIAVPRCQISRGCRVLRMMQLLSHTSPGPCSGPGLSQANKWISDVNATAMRVRGDRAKASSSPGFGEMRRRDSRGLGERAAPAPLSMVNRQTFRAQSTCLEGEVTLEHVAWLTAFTASAQPSAHRRSADRLTPELFTFMTDRHRNAERGGSAS